MKTDPRARYTQSIIRDAFFEIARKKPLSKITVSEICAIAGINRGTFYRYYMDVYDLSDQLVQEGLDHLEKIIRGGTGKSFQESFAEILRIFRNDQKFFFMAMSGSISEMNNDQNRREGFLEKIFIKSYSIFMDNSGPVLDPKKKAMLLSYISGGTAALIICWLRTHAEETPEEIAALIDNYASTMISAAH